MVRQRLFRFFLRLGLGVGQHGPRLLFRAGAPVLDKLFPRALRIRYDALGLLRRLGAPLPRGLFRPGDLLDGL